MCFQYEIYGKAQFHGGDTEEGETDGYVVVFHNHWHMDFASGLYLAETRDLDVT